MEPIGIELWKSAEARQRPSGRTCYKSQVAKNVVLISQCLSRAKLFRKKIYRFAAYKDEQYVSELFGSYLVVAANQAYTSLGWGALFAWQKPCS